MEWYTNYKIWTVIFLIVVGAAGIAWYFLYKKPTNTTTPTGAGKDNVAEGKSIFSSFDSSTKSSKQS